MVYRMIGLFKKEQFQMELKIKKTLGLLSVKFALHRAIKYYLLQLMMIKSLVELLDVTNILFKDKIKYQNKNKTI